MHFGRIWDKFLQFFGKILEGLQVAELTLMIRATRGRSMDPWIHGSAARAAAGSAAGASASAVVCILSCT